MSWWQPLVGVALGALLSGAFALLGVWRASRNEHKKWLRERRYEACVNYLAEVDKAFVQVTEVARAVDTDEDTLQAAGMVWDDESRPVQVVRLLVEAQSPIILLGPDYLAVWAKALTHIVSRSLVDPKKIPEIAKYRERFIGEVRLLMQVEPSHKKLFERRRSRVWRPGSRHNER